MSSADFPVSNYYGSTAIIVVSIIFPLLSALAILVRFAARRKSKQPLRADDWWIILTWLCGFGMSLAEWVATARAGFNYYKGSTDTEIAASEEFSIQGFWATALISQICLVTVKVSVLCFYKRIFVGWSLWICNTALVVVSLWGIIYFFLVLFIYNPISGAYTPGEGVTVLNAAVVYVSNCATSLFIDILVLCLPVPVVSRLQMSTSRKLAVIGIFWLGAFCCVAAALRLAYLILQTRDLYPDTNYTFLFLIVEPNCSIIAACLMTYGPLFDQCPSFDSVMHRIRSAVSLHGHQSKSKSHTSSLQNTRDDIDESQVELQQVATSWKKAQIHGEAHGEAQTLGVLIVRDGAGTEVTCSHKDTNELV